MIWRSIKKSANLPLMWEICLAQVSNEQSAELQTDRKPKLKDIQSGNDSFKSRSVADEAADWLLRIRENPDEPSLRSEFERWILAAPEHRREWEATIRLWRVMGEAPKHYQRRAVPASRLRTSRKVRVAGAMAASALAICLTLVAGPSMLVRLEADYRTSTAESRVVTLEDGSNVFLGPASAIASDFSSGARHVKLLSGEAFFNVTHDEARPFQVDAGEMKVTVLGTAFNVSLTDDVTQIGLEHGSVKATGKVAGAELDRILTPGQMLSVNNDTGTVTQEAIGPEEIGAWRNGRLIVINATIGSVVQQIQRYHPAWISIPDRNLANQRVTGVYYLNEPDKALGALVDPYGGKVHKVSDFARVIATF